MSSVNYDLSELFAKAAKAAYLVTGDSDLLDIKTYKDIKIITPRDFEALFT